jgi:hypothetical protein
MQKCWPNVKAYDAAKVRLEDGEDEPHTAGDNRMTTLFRFLH